VSGSRNKMNNLLNLNRKKIFELNKNLGSRPNRDINRGNLQLCVTKPNTISVSSIPM
jgi:hypothetical protein